MKLNQVGVNQNVLNIGDTEVLFSYSTPVAYRGPLGCFRTEVNYSVTTSKHIHAWGAHGFPTRPQSWFDSII